MKKVLTIIILFLVFIIIYFLHLNFFSWFTIAGVMPNLFVLYILFIGLYLGNKIGTAFGIVIGIIVDFIGSSVIGISAIALGIIGFLRRIFRKKLFER